MITRAALPLLLVGCAMAHGAEPPNEPCESVPPRLSMDGRGLVLRYLAGSCGELDAAGPVLRCYEWHEAAERCPEPSIAECSEGGAVRWCCGALVSAELEAIPLASIAGDLDRARDGWAGRVEVVTPTCDGVYQAIWRP